ncbi:hypothetical protein FH972_023314 [Carpinus fangiana]|uniref:Putative tRNA (cytidine(32)/guanosine(34)-2'-O)-methyltransferase n=1 Tax=Carpinus fangiana TaxID=176857 RepID=A0A5N6KUV2_9ROSI|nr:hypothetical protein FH972_023314 [Carpinus fangiana]
MTSPTDRISKNGLYGAWLVYSNLKLCTRRLAMGKSSKDKRDAYYRLAKEQGWRARSAFKLLQLDEEFNLFEDVTRVVDLCAAPGSWSQVLSRVLIKGEKFGRAGWMDKHDAIKNSVLQAVPEAAKFLEQYQKESLLTTEPTSTNKKPREDVKIVSIDLQPMSPLEGIITMQADITHPSTIPKLLKALDPDTYEESSITSSRPVDLVLSDGAPDVTGLHDLDIYIQSQLIWAALNLALCVLRPGGKFVAKIFRGKDVDLLYAQLKIVFEYVTVAKPRSSRASSVEAFIVCENFTPPKGFKPSLENPLGAGQRLAQDAGTKSTRTNPSRRVREDGITELDLDSDDDSADEHEHRWIAPFLACGDLAAYDADATYHLPAGHVSLDPVQPPTAPPYKKALEMRRAAGGAYGKTKTKPSMANLLQVVLSLTSPSSLTMCAALAAVASRRGLAQRGAHYTYIYARCCAAFHWIQEIISTTTPHHTSKNTSEMPSVTIDDSQLAGLKDKVVIVTGASSGIGLATVQLLLEKGAKVVSGDLNPPQETPASDSFIFQKTDVTVWAELLALFKTAKAHYGHIDHVFANAGIAGYAKEKYVDGELDDTGDPAPPDHSVLRVNLFGVMDTARLALHYFKTQEPPGGSLVLTGSGSSFSRFGPSEYTASKHGVLGFMRSLHDQLTRAALPVRVNTLAPAFTDTAIISAAQVRAWGMAVQSAEVVARSAVYLMANEACNQQLIYSNDGKYFEIEAELLQVGVAASTGDHGARLKGQTAGRGGIMDVTEGAKGTVE